MASLESLIKAKRTTTQTPAFSVMMIHYTKLIPSDMNAYSTESIEELANMIMLSGGVKQNLLARKTAPEEYELIAGHRRRLAVKYLVEERGLKEFAMVPVHVEKDGDLLSEIDLILTNCGARERSDWEKMMESTRMADLVKALQKGTEEEQKRFRAVFGCDPNMNARDLRKLVADTLGLSVTKVANLNHINSGLAPELKERFKNGDIGVTVANEAAGLPPECQIEMAEKKTISIADVKEIKSVSESDTEQNGDNSEQEKQILGQEEQIPGQMEIKTDFSDMLPDSTAGTESLEEEKENRQENFSPEPRILGFDPSPAANRQQNKPICCQKAAEDGVSESDTLPEKKKKKILANEIERRKRAWEVVSEDWKKDLPDIYWKNKMMLEALEEYYKKNFEN